MTDENYSVLVVDDNEDNREMLRRRLQRLGYQVSEAENGRVCLELARERLFDLILLDIMMPELNGYEVLEALKAEEALRHIPVIMISAVDELDSVVRCVELGAEDYLIKPFNPVLLKARVNASLDRKALQDQEKLYLHQIEAEKFRADELLRVILPQPVVEELKANNRVKPRRFEDVGVLICDIVGFTPYCERHDPEEVLTNLGELTEAFENHTMKFGLEKINSVGDQFFAASGLTVSEENPVLNCVRCGFEMISSAQQLTAKWQVRIGIHIGPVVAGIVGQRKFLYGLWGDTVNMAARAQAHGLVGTVNATRAAWDQIASVCQGESRGMIAVKGKGPMEMFRVDGVLL